MRQILSRSSDVILNIGEVETLYVRSVSVGGGKGENERTISDLGATDQFSLHRFESPFTTSAWKEESVTQLKEEGAVLTLLPMSRKRPMTFLRQVPILPPNHQHSLFLPAHI